jgi:hypothetical protein
MRRGLVASALVVVCVTSAACVDQGSGSTGKKVDPKYVAEHLVTELPATGLLRLDVSIGDRVVYVGNTLTRATDRPGDKAGDTIELRSVAPGDMVRITHFWRVVKPVGVGWRVFALLRGGPNTADFMNLPATDMQSAHGPALWKAGQLIADVQDIPLRPDWRSPTATLYVGLIAIGEHGIGDRMVASGNNTHDRAVIARVIDVDLSKAPPPPGTAYVPRASGPIAIDGASEPAWDTAGKSPDLVTAEGSPDPVGKASARLTWDEQFLYAFVAITDGDVVSQYKNHDDPLWKQDCVELFIDADRNGRGYVELQVNPNNATFDSWFEATRAKPGDTTWESGMQTAVQLRGKTTTEPGPGDSGWDVEIAIPWEAVRGRDDKMMVNVPPRVGDRWRLNIVRVDVKSGGSNPTASSWNRISQSDFHALDRMLTVVFADASGSIVPAGSSAPTPGPSAPGSTSAPAAPAPGSTSAPAAPAPGAGSGSAGSASTGSAGSAHRK